jgi:chromosome segregation ATPase
MDEIAIPRVEALRKLSPVHDDVERSKKSMAEYKMTLDEFKKNKEAKARSLQDMEEECSALETELSVTRTLKDKAAEIGRFDRECQLIKTDIRNLERDSAAGDDNLASMDTLKSEMEKLKGSRYLLFFL